MSKGISISSINQIKELAEEKRYAEALEILDTQDLDKSINPQFLRISGEIFRKNKRYYDCRRILLKAHQMAPQGTRIIFELIQLYLELGYFTLANKYYEEYNFYVGQEDTQKDFVEYIVKKANGAEIKELASILIPILERMPEDIWNYEAILLYDKLDRKDKALDESRFILENFKNSIYTERVISYIDDKLDVDKEFYVYPKEEQEEDVDVFGSLIDLEQEILEKDYLTMYPPEARIMVEVEDKDGIEVKPVKEKKPKKKRTKKPKKLKALSENEEQETLEDASTDMKEEPASDTDVEKETETKADSITDKKDVSVRENEETKTDSITLENISDKETDTEEDKSIKQKTEEKPEEQITEADTEKSVSDEEDSQEVFLNEEELIKKNREEALEKLLSKRFDAEKIKESAKQIAESVKGIDTSKAKSQVKNVTDLVTDNVKKASDALSEAVGTKAAMEEAVEQDNQNDSETIVDGIIESILEPPKQAVGQVVMNEELDSLVPDSIEAMSADEIADIESRKEEQERLELEALETSVKLEEEKRAKRKRSKSEEDEEKQSLYSELKNKYIEEFVTEETVADSLGFISVVHSDVDQAMEEGIPDTAQMLRQMIGNKEYYENENSLGFESKESYENHGFEIESYDSNSNNQTENFVYIKQSYNSDVYKVEDIYVETAIVSFDDLAPEEVIPMEDYVQSEEWSHHSLPIEEPVISVVNENFEVDESIFTLSENIKDSVDEEKEVSLEEAAYQEETANEEIENHPEGMAYEEVSNESEEAAYEEVSNEPEEAAYEEVSNEPEEAAYEEVSNEPEEAAYEEVSNEPEEAAYEEVSNEPEEAAYEEVSNEPEEAAYEEVSNEPEEAAYEEVSNEPVEAAYEEVNNEPEKTIYEEIGNKPEDFDSFEPVIGEQLSFEMITPMEKARKERMSLRRRIIVSESMKKKLLALKETK